ncbi:uncharacterized protein LOC135700039 [Ochlerotatus camptorhynchus]|uniref:uncharacterized protein LOC135700039 n=1 Tax=Ochlerotatus camptorhynchus TaxID=644619 RepID=UPI0031CE517F
MLENNRVKGSKLLQLAPFIDKEGLLRVGGRLKNAHHTSKILITALLDKEHLHVGQQGLLAIVRQRYWPIRGKNVVRQTVKKCLRCFRLKPPEVIQYMGNLPDCRVVPSPAFLKTGLDYAGPFYIRQGIRKATKLKSYICVLICMSTKAVHLELVSDLTIEAFLAALQRFIGRRGIPSQLFSDNATNFRGAHSELKELYDLFQSQRTTNMINELCTVKEIDWSFIPPRSPNFGGIWEAGVKAAKSHMRKVLGEASLNYEEMNTALVQIEGVLNSRPLTQLSEDPNDISALTPAHFLVGQELTAVPEPSYSGVKTSSLSRWQHLQKQKEDFWNRWSNEYLNQLQPRGKWYKNKVLIKKGMLVVIREDNMAPLQWRLGRIIQTHPGADGLIRVVTIRTSNGEVKRFVSKIVILPVEDNVSVDSSIDTTCQRGEDVKDNTH